MKYIIIALIGVVLCQGCQTVRHDEKLTVRELSFPAVGISRQHELTRTADNQLLASWVESEGSLNTVRFAVYANGNWQPTRTVAKTETKLAATPVVFGMSDGTFSAAWMQAVKNDLDRYAADIYWVRSKDGGQTWTTPIKPYNAQARIYDAQMSFAPMSDDKLVMVWTDSRFVNHHESEESANKTSRYQIMAAILENDGSVSKEKTLDNDACSCCRVYTDADGDELMTVYRDHLKGEIRDISAVHWNKNNISQQFPVYNDHWVINGCPSNGPSVDLANGNGVVAWFSAGDGKGTVRLAFTAENGSFKKPIVIDDHAIGFTKAILLDDSSALVAWRSNAGANEELLLARVTPYGEVKDRTMIYRGSFPRWPSNYIGLEKIGDEAYIAWTDPVRKKVRLVAISI